MEYFQATTATDGVPETLEINFFLKRPTTVHLDAVIHQDLLKLPAKDLI
jgi:hypothetical protein